MDILSIIAITYLILALITALALWYSVFTIFCFYERGRKTHRIKVFAHGLWVTLVVSIVGGLLFPVVWCYKIRGD